jgi:hypothetical protein
MATETTTRCPLPANDNATLVTSVASGDFGRDETIRRIREALRRRSGKTWSVTGGRGTAWGWIEIHVQPRQRGEYGTMPQAAREELTALLGLTHPVGDQGESVPAGLDYRREYVDRAEGRTPSVIAKPYWD